jgi:hypothetical protein
MKDLFKKNGLSLTLFGFFFLFLVGHFVSGHHVYNQEQEEHQESRISASEYLKTGHFLESVAENWESEFLQIFIYVLFTVGLYQIGSAESKDPGKKEKVDEDPELHRRDPDAPWPVKKGGRWLKLYGHSLSISLFLLFVVSFWLHLCAGFENYNEEQLQHSQQAATKIDYLKSSQFWFESFQNWQSEFLAVFALVLLSIFLREKGSPESKPVFFPHSHTGKE